MDQEIMNETDPKKDDEEVLRTQLSAELRRKWMAEERRLGESNEPAWETEDLDDE